MSIEVTEHVGVYVLRSTVTNTVCLGQGDAAKLDPKHRILCSPSTDCDRPSQAGATLVGPTFGQTWVCRSCSCNAHNALTNRHGLKQPLSSACFLDYGFLFPRLRLEYSLALLLYYDGWEGKWTKAKMAAITRSCLLDPVLAAKVKSFIKRECCHKCPSKARLIQGYRNLSTQESCAREFMCFQKALCGIFSVHDGGFELFPNIYVSIASGANSNAIAGWMSLVLNRHVNAHFYERDGKNWDSTMSKLHHALKLSFLHSIDPRLARFVDDCFKVTGVVNSRTGSGLVYRLEGTVKSGHNDTTSGNSLVNALIAAESFRKLGLCGSIIVAGDDLLGVVEGFFDVNALIACEAQYGITPEARIFHHPHDVTFISGCWLTSSVEPTAYAFVPLLGRLFVRLWWTTNPPRAKDLRNYRYSVVSGLLSACRGLPVYEEFLNCVDISGGSTISVDKNRYSPYCEATTGSFDRAVLERSMSHKYGCSVVELRSLAEFFPANSGALFMAHPVASVLIFRDTCDIGERPVTVAQTGTNLLDR